MKILKITHLGALVLLVFFMMFSCQKQVDKDHFALEGKIPIIPNKTLLLLRNYDDSVKIDTIVTNNNGFFIFTDRIDTLQQASLYWGSGDHALDFFVDGEQRIKIEVDDQDNSLLYIEGGDENNLLTVFKKKNRQKFIEKLRIERRLDSLLQETPSPNVGKIYSDLTSRLHNIHSQLIDAADEFVSAHPDRYASVLLLNQFLKNENQVHRLKNKLSQIKYPVSGLDLYCRLQAYVDKIESTQVGALAPFFREKDQDNKVYELYSYRGKYLILTFVGKGCPLCVRNMDEQEGLLREVFTQNVEMLTFLLEEPSLEHLTYLDSLSSSITKKPPVTKPSKWKVIKPRESWASPILENYNISGLPINILISPEGRIIARSSDIGQIRSILLERLAISPNR